MVHRIMIVLWIFLGIAVSVVFVTGLVIGCNKRPRSLVIHFGGSHAAIHLKSRAIVVYANKELTKADIKRVRSMEGVRRVYRATYPRFNLPGTVIICFKRRYNLAENYRRFLFNLQEVLAISFRE